MKTLQIGKFGIFALVLALSSAASATYYVSEAYGDDANNGTSWATPLKTLTPFTGGTPTKSLAYNTVIVSNGTYKISRPLYMHNLSVVKSLSGNPDGETVANEIVKTLASSLDDTGRPVFVIDLIASLERYQRLNPNFAAAFKFIKEKGWETQTPKDGKFYIDGEKVFAFVNEVQLKPWSQKLVEAHDEYIDIQIPLDGNEVFGVGRIDPRAPKHPTCADGKDIRFRVQDLFPVTVHPGEFAIFFPPVGAHAPCCSDGQSVRVKKLVVKVRTN